MYNLKPKSSFGKRSTVAIRRVLRQGDRYTCGVCRKAYNDETAAEQCLARCLSGYLNPAKTVNDETTVSGKRYRCHFCKRVYTDKGEAQKCAAACRSQSEATIAAESAISRPATVKPPSVHSPQPQKSVIAAQQNVPKKRAKVRIGQDHKYLRDGRKLVCRKCGLEHPTLDTVIACYDGHPVKEKKEKVKPQAPAVPVKKPRPVPAPVQVQASTPAPTNPQPAAVQPAAESAPVASAAVNDDHKFSRDGAKYVCRVCRKKFFTRGDVCECFDSHAAA